MAGNANDRIGYRYEKTRPRSSFVEPFSHPSSPFVSWLERLPEVLEYRGEFGSELILFLPFIRWLDEVGLLAGRTVVTYRGMRSFYRGLGMARFEEKEDQRVYFPPESRPEFLPIRDEHTFDGHPPTLLRFPDLRREFAGDYLGDALSQRLTKPLLIVHNKYCSEWGQEPINFIDLSTLARIFARFSRTYSVVYVRHGPRTLPGYVADHNTLMDLEDREVIHRFPAVQTFEDLFELWSRETGNQDSNYLKNLLYSRCFQFITTQGGGSHHISLFSGSIMVILHRRGRESEWAYEQGYYSFSSNPPPWRICCASTDELMKAIEVFRRGTVLQGRWVPSPSAHKILFTYTPARLREILSNSTRDR